MSNIITDIPYNFCNISHTHSNFQFIEIRLADLKTGTNRIISEKKSHDSKETDTNQKKVCIFFLSVSLYIYTSAR